MVRLWQLTLVLLGMATIGSSFAAKRSFEGQVTTGYEYDDNIQLRVNNPTVLHGFNFAPSVSYTYATPTKELSLSGLFNFARFDKTQFNSNDQTINLDFNNTQQSYTWGASGNIVNNSTRTSELEDTGIVTDQAVRRRSNGADAYIQWQLSERNGVKLNIGTEVVNFDSNIFRDFTSNEAGVTWLHQWSTRSVWHINLFASEYQAEQGPLVNAENTGILLGGTFTLGRTSKLSMLVGQQATQASYELTTGTTTIAIEEDTILTVGNLSLDIEAKRHDISYSLGREVRPSGAGLQNETSRLGFDYRYRLTKRGDIRLGLVYGQNRISAVTTNNERTYASASVSYARKMSLAWYIELRARYRKQSQAAVDNSQAESRSAFVELHYRP